MRGLSSIVERNNWGLRHFSRFWRSGLPNSLAPVRPRLRGAEVGSSQTSPTCDPFAIRLLVYHCFPHTFMPSVALHVIEFTLSRGFDSHTLPPVFNNLQTAKSPGEADHVESTNPHPCIARFHALFIRLQERKKRRTTAPPFRRLQPPPISRARGHNWRGTDDHTLNGIIWYPAEDSAGEKDQYIGPPDAPLFYAGRAAKDATLAPSFGKFPLIALSHGTGGSAISGNLPKDG